MLDLYFQSQTDPVMRFAICGLPAWTGIARNDTAAFINDILVATVNGPCAIFAFLSNLAIIVAVIKNPALQKHCNILLCSLQIASQVSPLSQCLSCGDSSFRELSSHVYTKLWFLTYITLSTSLQSACLSSTLSLSVSIAIMLCPGLWCILLLSPIKMRHFLTSIVTVKSDARPCNYANSYRNAGMFIGSLLCAIFNRREHFAHDGFKFAPVAFSEVFQEHHICTLRVWPIGQNLRRYLL